MDVPLEELMIGYPDASLKVTVERHRGTPAGRGFSHAYFMVDPGSGKAISVTIWESEDVLRASSTKADELREKGTTPSGTSITSVEHYEIPLTVRAHTTTGA